MNGMKARVNGAQLSLEQIQAWERMRALAVHRRLRKRLGMHASADPATWSIQRLRNEIAQTKLDAGRQTLRAAFQPEIRVSGAITRLLVLASRGRRKQCVTEMTIPGCTAQSIFDGLNDLMLRDAADNDAVNLAACPDHYLLEPNGDTLEVIETTGGSPFAAQFFLRYGDETGLIAAADPSFSHQSFGTARLKDGTAIGGVRHQFRDANGEVHARLMVEFPYATPTFMIRQHQIHLACEFSNWFERIRS